MTSGSGGRRAGPGTTDGVRTATCSGVMPAAVPTKWSPLGPPAPGGRPCATSARFFAVVATGRTPGLRYRARTVRRTLSSSSCASCALCGAVARRQATWPSGRTSRTPSSAISLTRLHSP